MSQSCPCFSGKLYKDCCQPLHKGKIAATPVALVRSRYAAYALGKFGYVYKTWHPQSPLIGRNQTQWRNSVKQLTQQTTFAGLRILDQAQIDGVETVKFHAILFQGAQDVSFIETSTFLKKAGRWLYFDSI